MKLIINIPCYNEERTLPLVLKELPKEIKGIDEIIVQVINDGSTDKTEEIARKYGCEIISFPNNKGLGHAFKTGMLEALERGADIMVNTDGDNQYPGKYIPELIQPLINNEADMVIADRQTSKIKHFSMLKRLLQSSGSYTARKLSGTQVKDTVSGFRAYSREAMLRLNVTSKFSYVLDTIVQAGKKDLKIKEIKIKTNKPTRKSRLFKNIFEHVKRSGGDLIRVYVLYEPFKTFFYTSLIFLIPGLFLILRFFYFYLFVESGYVQSLIISAILITTALTLNIIGILAHLNMLNRRLTEENIYLQKKSMFKK